MSKRNKDVDEALRKKQAKLRFKRLIGIAFANHQWINESDDQDITLNVKKNVAMLVRKKHKTGILTMAQKGLLATSHQSRSIAERKKLCTIVAAMGCFAQIPPKMRARLVPYLHFMVVGAGRILMKEGDVPTVVYFVVSGEVEMSRTIYNKITRKYEPKPEAFFGPGDWIGEVELLEENLRMNTYKVTTNCEILVLDDFDFRTLLQPYVNKVWVEKKQAIASLSYLKFLNEAQIISACKFGTLRQYDPLSTIFPESADNLQHVHFVLSGECLILQCLSMTVSYDKGEVHYELRPADEDQMKGDDVDDKPEAFDVRELLLSNAVLDETDYKEKQAKRKAEFDKIEANCVVVKQKQREEQDSQVPHPFPQQVDQVVRRSFPSRDKTYLDYVIDEDYEGYDGLDGDEEVELFDADRPIGRTTKSHANWVRRLSKSIKQGKSESEGEESEMLKVASDSSSDSKSELSVKIQPKAKDESNHATHFVDVGSMTFGGLFGVEEKCEHRVIMARTTVQCLLIPRYWLMEEEQNQGHIWQRMRFYLDRCIPSREKLFENFIKTRKWAQFKNECVQQISRSTITNTKIEDIPIIIRIVESKESSNDSGKH